MNTSTQPGADFAREIIEAEKKRDRLVRRVSAVAWAVTFLVMLIFSVTVALDVAEALNRVGLGVASLSEVRVAVMPLIAVIGTTSLLLALVSTVGVFLRFRTASLADIQLRLATLETMLSDE